MEDTDRHGAHSSYVDRKRWTSRNQRAARNFPHFEMNCCELENFIMATPAAPFFNGFVEPGPSIKLRNGFWVLYLNPLNQEVGHYAGIRIKNERAWLFNSLGDANTGSEAKTLLAGFTTTCNVARLQSSMTQVCGLYVVYYFIR